SYDTPATVDLKSLRDLMVMNAAYTYFLASAGAAEKRWLAEVALTRAYDQVSAAAGKIVDHVAVAANADRLGRLLYQGRERVEYVLDSESQAVRSAWPLDQGVAGMAAFGQQQKARVERAVSDRAAELQLGTIQPVAPA